MARKRFLTLREVLDELDIGRSTFNRWMQLGEAPKHVRLPGGQLRFPREDFDRWIAEHTQGTEAA
ncbi:MAG TPA: helix-turn-helix domain-containing protein [Mycobacteriales bacterium]|nr:helix-turn-helix domain-containing protein [Mycobacteriales bacterium]